MAKTIIREYDMSRGVLNTVSDFAVVVPGFADQTVLKSSTVEPRLDVSENGIYRFTSVKEFVNTVGKMSPKLCKHLGNQIAYELLVLGYTVYFKEIPQNPVQEVVDWDADITTALEDEEFWEDFKDNKTYRDVRYLLSGLDPMSDATRLGTVAREMDKVVKFINKPNSDDELPEWDEDNGRGDAIALIDFPLANINQSTMANLIQSTKAAINIVAGDDGLSRYSAIFGPSVTYDKEADEDYGNNNTFPASFHYLACAAYSQERFAEWYAIAGYSRGISHYSVKNTYCDYGNLVVNKIAPRRAAVNESIIAANLIVNERGNYYLWGNRTAEKLDEYGLKYRHFLNIRQLCTTIKKQILYVTNTLEFNPNSDRLWVDFEQAVSPVLRRMQSDQGIRGFEFTRKQNNELAVMSARIRIIPIEAVEDFDINLGLVDNLEGGANVVLQED